MIASLLQLADSAFPNGAFSHSFGLETAIREGRAGDADGVAQWMYMHLRDSLTPADGAAIALVARGASADDVEARLMTLMTCSESRDGAARIGRASLAAFAAMGLRSPELDAYARSIDAGRSRGHAATAFALGALSAGIDAPDAVEAYVANALANLASVAVRAIPIGQRDAQRLLWALRGEVRNARDRACSVREIDGLGSWGVAAEIDAMRHRRLDERIFAS